MDTIKYILGKVFRLALALLIIAFVIWLLNLLYPGLKITSLFDAKIFTTDWLPAPKNYGSIGQNVQKDQYGTVYVHNPNYIYYATGTQSGVFMGNTSPYTSQTTHIRNLSLYNGAPIYEGYTFTGEARETMFRNGMFPIVIVNREGQFIASLQAMNTGTWATPGWARFQATVPVKLPSMPCVLVFLSAEDRNVQVRQAVQCK